MCTDTSIKIYFGGCIMATKKRTSKSKRKSNKPSAAEVRKVEEFRLEIVLWIFIACSLLLFVSNFAT